MLYINDQLLELYQKHWASYLELRSGKLARPLLIKIKNEDNYTSSNIKVMILGQETNSWIGGEPGTLITPLPTMDGYVRFFNDGDKVDWSGPFWNEAKRFMRLISLANANKKVSYMYNNVVKIGKDSGAGFPGDAAFDNELKSFNVLREEIAILKPNLLLFFSGPNYDGRIEKKLGSYERLPIDGFNTNKLCKIKFSNSDLFMDSDSLAYRTYHPNYMYRKGINRREIYDAIISDFSKSL